MHDAPKHARQRFVAKQVPKRKLNFRPFVLEKRAALPTSVIWICLAAGGKLMVVRAGWGISACVKQGLPISQFKLFNCLNSKFNDISC